MRMDKLVGRISLLSLLGVFALGIVLAGCGSDKVKMGTAPQEQESVLFTAIAAGDLATVQAEISRDASLLNQTEGGFVQTPLHKAVRAKQLEIIRFLIESGAEINTMDALGRTPLSAAMDEEAGDEIIKLLQDNGAED
ncbi:MAG: ankyrin repeat domain-containing protein [Candidatus Hydrogenedentes bacterium]|nr:ankyrin repeat domain-containing protein [Candidatus Hydrogenedentota bacterium]